MIFLARTGRESKFSQAAYYLVRQPCPVVVIDILGLCPEIFEKIDNFIYNLRIQIDSCKLYWVCKHRIIWSVPLFAFSLEVLSKFSEISEKKNVQLKHHVSEWDPSEYSC